jgi:AsmA protein
LATGIKRFGIVVALVVAVGLCALVTLSMLIPADTVRDQIKAQILAATGLDLVLSGDVDVSLFPSGSVTFSKVSFGYNRSAAATLTAEQLMVRLRLLPFLAGRIEIADVAVVRPIITVAFDHNGTTNWATHVDALARALLPSPDRETTFSEIRIADGTLVLQSEAQEIKETLTNVEFALAWPSISKSFAATGHFVWHDEPIDATFSLTDFISALTGERSGLKLRLASTPLKFAFDGNITHKPTLRMSGILSADTVSLRDTLQWAGSWSSSGNGLNRFALKAQADIAGGNISLTGVNVDLDGNAGEGVLSFANDGRKTLQGTLAVEALDLTPYVSTVRLLVGNDWNRRPLALDALNSVDMDLRLSAARVTLGNAKLGRTAVAANLRGGNLNVAIGESQAFGGIASGSLGLAAASEGGNLKAQLQFAEVDLDQSLGELFGLRRVEGKGDIAFNLAGAGTSVFEIMQGMNGTATLNSRKGAVTGINVEQLLRRLERNPLAGRSDFRGGKTPYDTMTVNLKITQGLVNIEELHVDAPSVRLTLAGTASLPSRDLDLKGTATLMASSAPEAAATFELPFLVQGPWHDPFIWPDAQALIKRSGAAAPLLDAVRGRLKREPAMPSQAEPSGTPPAISGR